MLENNLKEGGMTPIQRMYLFNAEINTCLYVSASCDTEEKKKPLLTKG
jgi:hypothetical protein